MQSSCWKSDHLVERSRVVWNQIKHRRIEKVKESIMGELVDNYSRIRSRSFSSTGISWTIYSLLSPLYLTSIQYVLRSTWSSTIAAVGELLVDGLQKILCKVFDYNCCFFKLFKITDKSWFTDCCIFTAVYFYQYSFSFNICDALLLLINNVVFLRFIDLQSIHGAVSLYHVELNLCGSTP